MIWRMFFKNFAVNRDYINNYFNNPYDRFQKYCYEGYFYNLSKNNTAIYYKNVEQNNLKQLHFFMF